MKRIAIDMDEVIADFVTKQLRLYNEEHGENITMEELQGHKLRHYRSEHMDKIISYLQEPSFFRDLGVMKDSQEVIKELSESYDIFITTAAMEFPTSFAAKYEWLKEHFSFLSDQNFVFCGNKKIINADFLIDDNVKHFPEFAGKPLLFTAPHNIHELKYTRVNNWLEVREYFRQRA